MTTRRDTAEHFATPTHLLDGLSLEKRPGAVSWDYLSAFSFGPDAAGDVTHGVAARLWRARADGGAVRLSRAADGNAAWEAETVLFAYTGAAIREVDLAFDQNANPVVCAERATGAGGAAEVWLYWYDPSAVGFRFAFLCPGRTPRVLLDETVRTHESDVLLFYVSDADDAVCYRQQRDRYAVRYLTPRTGTAGLYLEEVAKAADGRVAVIVSQTDPATGALTLPPRLESSLYPLTPDAERVGAGAELRAMEVRRTAIPGELERMDVTLSCPLTLLVVRPLVFTHRQPTEADYPLPSAAVRALDTRSMILQHRQPTEETRPQPSIAVRTLETRRVIISQEQPTEETHVQPAASVRSLAVGA